MYCKRKPSWAYLFTFFLFDFFFASKAWRKRMERVDSIEWRLERIRKGGPCDWLAFSGTHSLFPVLQVPSNFSLHPSSVLSAQCSHLLTLALSLSLSLSFPACFGPPTLVSCNHETHIFISTARPTPFPSPPQLHSHSSPLSSVIIFQTSMHYS